jgi:hypothetical protein
VVEVAREGDLAALAEVLAAVDGLATEGDYVEVVGALVLAVLPAAALHGDAHLAPRGLRARGDSGVLGEPADEVAELMLLM